MQDEKVSAYMFHESQTAYSQDEDALNWIQATYDELVDPPEELSFGPDRPGLMMRQLLLKMAQSETKTSNP